MVLQTCVIFYFIIFFIIFVGFCLFFVLFYFLSTCIINLIIISINCICLVLS